MNNNKTIIYIVLSLIVLGLLWYFFGRGAATPDSNQSLQQQLETSEELKDVVHSKRNDFTAGSYTLDTTASRVEWKYGNSTGQMPVKNGSLKVLDSGRIEGFTVEADTTATKITTGDVKVDTLLGTTLLNVKQFPTAKMVASTVLPNTVDEAFTVAFSLDAAGKNTSLATGMFVTHEAAGVMVKGDVTIDPKTLGFADATETLTISPVFVFK